MAQSQTAPSLDRLPWLPDDSPAAKRSGIASWLAAGVIVVAGASYVLATKAFDNRSNFTIQVPRATRVLPKLAAEHARRVETPRPIRDGHANGLHPPALHMQSAVNADRVATSEEQLTSASQSSASASSVAVPSPRRPQTAPANQRTAPSSPPVAPKRSLRPIAYSNTGALIDMPAPRPPSQISGQVVHLAAFADRPRAEAVWRDMERSYPPLSRFRASLIQNRDYNGRAFYQFEVGTASQRDSEMLCQTMARLSYRCSVVGLRPRQNAQR
jgi:hypothetical protein